MGSGVLGWGSEGALRAREWQRGGRGVAVVPPPAWCGRDAGLRCSERGRFPWMPRAPCGCSVGSVREPLSGRGCAAAAVGCGGGLLRLLAGGTRSCRAAPGPRVTAPERGAFVAGSCSRLRRPTAILAQRQAGLDCWSVRECSERRNEADRS